MSRIGKKPIEILPGVTVTVTGSSVTVKGPKGELTRVIHPDMAAEVKGSELLVTPIRETRKSSALWGLTRSLLANMVAGVTAGFAKKLEFEGVGYRVILEGGTLVMRLGFSHPVQLKPPAGISFTVEKNVVTVSGIDKERVGEVAATLRSTKPVEPYKGKGFRYQGEVVRRKAGKKAVASS